MQRLYEPLDSPPFVRREEGVLLLLELEEAPRVGGQGERQGYVTSRLLHDKDQVASVVSPGGGGEEDELEGDEPAELAAYWLTAEQAGKDVPHMAFLLQKEGGQAGEQEGKKEESVRVVGKPLLLVYDAAWSCARFRFAVWRQVQRFLSASSSTPSMSGAKSDTERAGSSEDEEEEAWRRLLLEGGLEVSVCHQCSM